MPRRILDRARLISGYLRGSSASVPGPSALMVETTVRCNLLCPMCPRTGEGYPPESLPDELLYGALADHARLGGDHAYLYGLGEPLLDERIFDIIRYCHDRDVGTVLSTNGTLLTAERRKRLIESGCDHLLIGLDGASEETYAYYRAGGQYDEVVERVEALAAENAAAGSPMTIVVQFIRMARNRHEADAFLERWSQVEGIDQVRLKEEDIGLPDHATGVPPGDSRINPCHLLWRGPLVVRYTGDVYACYPMAERGEPLGNLREQSLAEIWDGETMRHLRELHVEGRSGEQEICATCPCPRPRWPFILGAMAVRGTTLRRLVPIAERVALHIPGMLREPDPPSDPPSTAEPPTQVEGETGRV